MISEHIFCERDYTAAMRASAGHAITNFHDHAYRNRRDQSLDLNGRRSVCLKSCSYLLLVSQRYDVDAMYV
jgi:hypothetical protein